MPEMQIIADNLWWMLALAASIFAAAFSMANQFFQADTKIMIFWRGLVPAITLFPALFFVEMPTSWIFYLATIVTGIIVIYIDRKFMDGTAKYGGGVISMLMPTLVWTSFIIWFAIDSSYRAHFFENMNQSILVVTALIIGVVSSMLMKKCSISTEAFKFMLPFYIMAMCVDPLNKTAMDNSTFWGGVIWYSWVQGAIVAIGSYMILWIKHKESRNEILAPINIKQGLWIGILIVITSCFKNGAMSYTINPAYVSAIIFTSPIWVMIFYKIIGHKEKANMIAGLAFVLSAILLIIAT